MFCSACGTQKPEGNAQFCANCGAGHSASDAVPASIAGWSWGAFFLNWIWAVSNRTWVGLFAMVPYIGFGVAIWLGVKGREMAWKNARWESVEHFNRVQRKWSQWGIGVGIVGAIFGVFLSIFIFSSVIQARKSDVPPFSQELTDAIASKSESACTASEENKDCTADSDE